MCFCFPCDFIFCGRMEAGVSVLRRMNRGETRTRLPYYKATESSALLDGVVALISTGVYFIAFLIYIFGDDTIEFGIAEPLIVGAVIVIHWIISWLVLDCFVGEPDPSQSSPKIGLWIIWSFILFIAAISGVIYGRNESNPGVWIPSAIFMTVRICFLYYGINYFNALNDPPSWFETSRLISEESRVSLGAFKV